MDIKAYIDGGAVESYVMGVLPMHERAEFERLCREYPELEKARQDFEIALEEHAFAHAIQPPASLKTRIMNLIRNEAKTEIASPVVALNPQINYRRHAGMRWAIAASVLLIVGCSAFIFLMYQKSRQLKQEVAENKELLQKLDDKKAALEEQSKDPVIKQVNMTLPGQTVPAQIKVYWDSLSHDAYLVIRDLPPLKAGEKYQLWAINKDKHISLGNFDAPKDDKLIMRMTNVQQAEAFAITISKEVQKP